ncbi:hypothetical protein roselon_01105 [Roseibacterium elongatum DSM 19469]|uniref:Uncharacterized protein n=1 Tax=Roseicyclus elongatus DSM 19469 TaxID=1294273 RepID=W8S057_9RHOB|nr:photosynthetic complex assembly protein PuhC [Roseibacterium elongatum]AHM03502.1 hypothetical protein roselon_01105 [Roseibacterium elongatum DSM 19469]
MATTQAREEGKLVKRDKEMVPTILVRAMFILCLCVLLIVTYARLTDRPLEATPPPVSEVPAVQERTIRIFGQMDGSARVMDVDGHLIASFSPEEGGVCRWYLSRAGTRTRGRRPHCIRADPAGALFRRAHWAS